MQDEKSTKQKLRLKSDLTVVQQQAYLVLEPYQPKNEEYMSEGQQNTSAKF